LALGRRQYEAMASRETVREDLKAGLTPDQIYQRRGKTASVWRTAIEDP
jgi:hypothetical protein